MPNVQNLLEALEAIAPSRYAFSFDKVGLQVGNLSKTIKRGVVSLDRSLDAVEFCKSHEADVLVAHHPLIFSPISSIDNRSHVGRTILALVKADIAFVAAHTNWDSARGGVNDALAEALGIHDVHEFGESAQEPQLKLVMFCPDGSVEACIDAAAAAGAGVIGNYKRCATITEGKGTFEPQLGANPRIGKVGKRETVGETRVEMVLAASAKVAVEEAVWSAHPYEEPAYNFFSITPLEEQPIGRIGSIATLSLKDFAQFVDGRLGTRCWTWGNPATSIRKVAAVGGAAEDEWLAARNAGADVLVTGEVRQHVAVEAVESGMCLIAAGHYATEQPGCASLRQRLADALPDVEWMLFIPDGGHSGRPF